MKQGSTKRPSLPLIVVLPIAALLIAVIVGAAMLVASTLRFFMFPLSMPLTTAVVAVTIAAWISLLVWQAVGSE